MNESIHRKKVALITDWMTAPGGADRLLQSIAEIFQDVDIYTALYFPENYQERYKIKNRVHNSFLYRFPFSRKFSRHYNLFSPLAFESFDLNKYDLVISLSAGASKGVITQPDIPHVGIILTPPRSLWDGESNTRGTKLKSIYKMFSPFISSYLRIWDQTAIKRVDHIISISKFIQKKVQYVYQLDSDVIYPGLDKFWYEDSTYDLSDLSLPHNYFLVVSRLYDYKRVDWAIKAAKMAKKKLIIVGEGPDKSYLQKLAGDETRFLGWVSDEAVRALYSDADALLFCGIEDYGYVPVEAMASGCPVLAYNKGGVTETVKDGESGEFFSSVGELSELLADFDISEWDRDKIKERSKQFSEEIFKKSFTEFLKEVNAI